MLVVLEKKDAAAAALLLHRHSQVFHQREGLGLPEDRLRCRVVLRVLLLRRFVGLELVVQLDHEVVVDGLGIVHHKRV